MIAGSLLWASTVEACTSRNMRYGYSETNRALLQKIFETQRARKARHPSAPPPARDEPMLGTAAARRSTAAANTCGTPRPAASTTPTCHPRSRPQQLQPLVAAAASGTVARGTASPLPPLLQPPLRSAAATPPPALPATAAATAAAPMGGSAIPRRLRLRILLLLDVGLACGIACCLARGLGNGFGRSGILAVIGDHGLIRGLLCIRLRSALFHGASAIAPDGLRARHVSRKVLREPLC